MTHAPPMHPWPEAQVFPHAPQLLLSEARSAQAPAQTLGVTPGQVQVPLSQDCPVMRMTQPYPGLT